MISKQNRSFRTVSALCTVAFIFSLTGCGGNATNEQVISSSGNLGSSSGNSAEKESFSIIVPFQGEQAKKDNIVEKTLEEKTNSEISIEWTPMISYGDKYNVLISSGQLPDVLLVPDVKGGTYLSAARNNQFWDLTSYLQNSSEYPDLKNINDVTIANSKTDGKNYVIPRERNVKRKDICWRADWAKKAGLDTPDTLDKVYKMAKTFAEGDFDGNGKKDTIGFMLGTVSDGGGQTIDCMNELVVANGGYNGWGIKNGNMVADLTTQEYFDTIKWLRKMCAEGIISKDFPIIKTTSQLSDYVDKEKSGLWMSYGLPGLSDPVLKAKQKVDPNIKRSDIYGFTYLKDNDGKPRIPAETGYNGGYAIPKSSVKDEGKLKGILRVFDFICSKEGQRLVNNGIEGRHYKKVDETTCEVITKDSSGANLIDEFNCMDQLSCAGNYVLTSKSDDIGKRLAQERKTYQDSDLIRDLSAPLVSETASDKLPVLQKDFDTALFKYILGQTDDSDFKAAVQKWKSDGGDQIAKEYTDAYKKAQQK